MATIAKRQRGEPVESAAAWTITNMLSWVVLALGTATAGFTIFLVIRSFTPVLYVDQWSIINHLLLNGKDSSLQWFWTQHNEHRLPIVKALELMDLYWFGNRRIFAGLGVSAGSTQALDSSLASTRCRPLRRPFFRCELAPGSRGL
jgi:hypothetical protein